MEPLNTSSLDAVDVDKSADVDYLTEQPLSAKDDKLVPGTVSIDANDVDVSRNTQGQLTTCGSHNSVNRPIISAPQAQQVFYRGYENTSGEWEEYSHYINAESFEAGSTDVYNENSSLMFHSGYGYSPHIPPYEPYSPVTTPLPSASGDSQQHFSQIFPFASPYYRQPPPPSMPYLTSPTPISQPGLTIPTTPVEHQSAFVADNSNVVPLGPRPDYSLPYGSFGREFFFGNSSNPGFYDLHQGFDGFGSGGFWSDWPKSPDGIGFTTPLSSLAGSPQPTGAFGSFGHGMGPVVSGLASQQHKSSYCSSTSSYDRGYIHGGMYHQGGNFGGSIPSIGTNGRGFIAIDKGRRRGKGKFSVCSCSGSPDFLNEQNRGPRSTKPKNISVEHKLAVDSINDNSSAVLDRESYNWLDFSTDYKDAKFFIIKSYSEDNIHKSIKYGVWASTSNGNRKLDFAYREAKGKGDSCSVFLFFSVNASAQFCGVAEMVGPVDFEKSVDYWQQDKWSGQFPVKWHIIKDVPNNLFRHIILENNDNKPVTNSRDTQEVKLEQGLEMLSTFKKHEADMSILDDFAFYEERQKAMQEKKAARQQLQQSSSCTGTVLPAAVEEVQNISRPNKGGSGGEGVIVNHITKTFAQVVRLDETSKPADLLVDKRSSTSGDVDANANVNANTNANTDVHPAGKPGDSKISSSKGCTH